MISISTPKIMEIREEHEEVQEMALTLPTTGIMQIAGRNHLDHRIEFLSHPCNIITRNSEIDVENFPQTRNDVPLPIFLKVYGIAFLLFCNLPFLLVTI